MRHCVLVSVLALSVWVPACAQEADSGAVRQLSTTQAHLLEMAPPGAGPSGKHALLRLVGKLLSEQLKDVRFDTGASDEVGAMGDAEQLAAPALSRSSGVHFNRRAEICFDNYRIGVKKAGLAVRYERSF